MKRPGNVLEKTLNWTCDGFTVVFGLWSVLSQAVVLLGGTGLALRRLSALVPFLAAGILYFAGRVSPPRPDGPTAVGEGADQGGPAGPKPHLPALVGAVLLSLFYILSSRYVLFWAAGCLFLGYFYLKHLSAPLLRPPSPGTGPAELAVFALIAVAVLFLTLFVHRPHPDDSLYLSVAVEVYDHPELPLMSRDTLHGVPGMSFLAPQHRLRTYDVLVGQTAGLLGIKPIAAAHLLFPPLFALVFLAAAAKLLRQLLGRAWLFGLAAVVILLAVNGDMETAYGNSAFVLLFQGRGVLVTVMVPLLTAYGLEFMAGRRPAGMVWTLLFLRQAAALSFSTNALFIGPIAAGLAMAAAWRPDRRSFSRLALGATVFLFPLALGLVLRANAVPEQFYQVTSPSWALVSARGLNTVLGWRPFTAFWLAAFLGGWAVLSDRACRRWMIGFSLLFLLVFMNPLLTAFWAKNLTSVVTFFRLYWAFPLPFFLAVLLAGAVFSLRRPLGGRFRAACLAGVLVCFALAVPARRTWSASNGARIGWPGMKVPQTFYAVAQRLSDSTPKGSLVLAPETVAAWIPTIPGHPAAVVTREMHLRQQRSRMNEEDYRRRRQLFLYIGGVEKVLRTKAMDALFIKSIDRLRIAGVAVPRSNPWLARIEAVLLGRGFVKADSPSRHFLIFFKTGSQRSS